METCVTGIRMEFDGFRVYRHVHSNDRQSCVTGENSVSDVSLNSSSVDGLFQEKRHVDL